MPNQLPAQSLVQRHGGRSRFLHDLKHKPESLTRPELSRGADQRFAEVSAASAWPDEEPRDHRQLDRRASRGLDQLCIIDAHDERNVPGYDTGLLGNPRAKPAW